MSLIDETDAIVQFPTPFSTPQNDEQEPTTNYNSYNVFVTKNKLTILVQDVLARLRNLRIVYYPVTLSQHGVPSSVTIYVRIQHQLRDLRRQEISDQEYQQLESGLEDIFTRDRDIALIWTNDLQSRFPLGWLANIISTISVAEKIWHQTIIGSRRIKIYGRFEPESNYNDKYIAINQDIQDQIDFLWQQGTICVPDSDVSRMQTDWKLELLGPNRYGHGQILQAPWIAPIHRQYDWSVTPFLLARLNQPDSYTSFDIGTNLVTHFGLAQELHQHNFDMHFDASRVYLNVTNYKQLQLVAILLVRAQTYSGRILPLTARTLEKQQQYVQAVVDIAGPDKMNRRGQIVTLRRRAHDESYVTLVKIDGHWQPQHLKSLIEKQIK